MPQVSLLTDSDPAPYSAGNYFTKLVDTQTELNSKSAEVETARGIEANLNARFTAVIASTDAINTDLTNNYYDKTGTEQYVQGQIMTGGVDWSTFGDPLDLLRLNAAGTAPEGVDPALYQTDWSSIGTANQVIVMNGTGDDVVGVNASTLSSQMTTKVDLVTSTDNAIPKFNGTSGAIQNTGVIIDDNNNMSLTNNTNDVLSITTKNINTGVNAYTANIFVTDNATTGIYSHSTGRTNSRYGETVGGSSEYLSQGVTKVLIGTTNNSPIIFGTNNVKRMRIDSTGSEFRAGSGTLDIQGGDWTATYTNEPEIFASSVLLVRAGNSTPNVLLLATGGWNVNSDIRYKHDVKRITNCLERCVGTNVSTFIMNGDDTNTTQLGVIAQDVVKHSPECVTDLGDSYVLEYSALNVIAIGGVKELKVIVDSQQKQIDDLTSLINTQQQAITALQHEVELLKS